MTIVPLRLVLEEDDPRQALPFAHVETDGVDVEVLVDSGDGRSQIIERRGPTGLKPVVGDAVGASGMPLATLGRVRGVLLVRGSRRR